MTTKTPTMNYGEPAFPEGGYIRGGMSLREYYAGQALAGLVTINAFCPPEEIADDAFLYADAMIAHERQSRLLTEEQYQAVLTGLRMGKRLYDDGPDAPSSAVSDIEEALAALGEGE